MLTNTDALAALEARVAALEAELANAKEAIREVAVVVVRVIRHHGQTSSEDFQLNNKLGAALRLLGPAITKAA
jgi:uncharacterized coiled-coil protein SlyX